MFLIIWFFCAYLAFLQQTLFTWLSMTWLEFGLNITSSKIKTEFEMYLADLWIHGAVSLYVYKKHVYCKSVLR